MLKASADNGLSSKQYTYKLPKEVLSSKYQINRMQYYYRRGQRVYFRNAYGQSMSFDTPQYKDLKRGEWYDWKIGE